MSQSEAKTGRSKRVLLVLLALLVVIGGALAAVAIFVAQDAGGEGEGYIEQWIAGQLKGVANGYLNPQLEFDSLDFQYPKTIVLRNARLTAPDPDNGGELTDIATIEVLTLEMAEAPSVGQPLRIQNFRLEKPVVQALAIDGDMTNFVGFSNLLKADPEDVAEDERPEEAGPGPKLSDIFEIRKIELIDATIRYDARTADTEPFYLDDINTNMGVEPTGDGWYTLKTQIIRAPVFDLNLDGRLNIDSFAFDAAPLTLALKLGEEHDQYLPPQLQQLRKQYAFHGQANVEITGMLPLMDWQSSDIGLAFKLDNGGAVLMDHPLEIEAITVDASLADKVASLKGLQLNAFGGQTRVAGDVKLGEPNWPAALTVNVDQLDLGEVEPLVKTVAAAATPEASASGNASADAAGANPFALENISWDGTLTVAADANAKLMDDAGQPAAVDALMQALAANAKVTISDAMVGILGEQVQFASLDVDANFANALATLNSLTLNAFGGRTTANGTLKPADPAMPVTYNANISNLDLATLVPIVKAYVLATAESAEPATTPTTADQADQDNDAPEADAEATAPAPHPITEMSWTGRLNLTADGQTTLQNAMAGNATANLNVADGSITRGEHQAPLDQANVNANLANQQVNITQANVQAFGGTTDVTGVVGLGEAMPANLKINLQQLNMVDLINLASPNGQGPDVRGNLALDATYEGQLANWDTQSNGKGQLNVTEGSLVRLPVLSDLTEVVTGALKALEGKEQGGSDSIRVDYQLLGDTLQIDDSEIKTEFFLLTGQGQVGFDGDLDLRYKGGAVEKATEILGGLGKAIGKLSSGLAAYKITGNVEDPKIDLVPLGGFGDGKKKDDDKKDAGEEGEKKEKKGLLPF